MVNLKPCPFCGGEAYARWDSGNKGAFGYACIECKKCGAVPYVHQVYFGSDKNQAVAGVAEAWNRRADEKAGKWEPDEDGESGYHCPFCGTSAPASSDQGSIRWKERRFCYFCGAKLH